jgi:hypothetical protein
LVNPDIFLPKPSEARYLKCCIRATKNHNNCIDEMAYRQNDLAANALMAKESKQWKRMKRMP